MNPSPPSFSPAQASAALGVSAKALRLYEQHGLLAPTALERDGAPTSECDGACGRIVALRGLGLSLAQVARVLDGTRRISTRAFRT